MAYSNFTLKDLKRQFGISNTRKTLFNKKDIEKVNKSDWLKKTLELGQKVPLRTEKIRSELILIPLLLELKNRNNDFFTFYSGEVLNVDKDKGLNGECDFLISQEINSYSISTPIISVIEAKKGDVLDEVNVGQCAAQMYGSFIFNQQEESPVNVIYGCVTSGTEWKFLKLEDNLITVDESTFYLTELETVLGIFQHIIDYYKSILT